MGHDERPILAHQIGDGIVAPSCVCCGKCLPAIQCVEHPAPRDCIDLLDDRTRLCAKLLFERRIPLHHLFMLCAKCVDLVIQGAHQRGYLIVHRNSLSGFAALTALRCLAGSSRSIYCTSRVCRPSIMYMMTIWSLAAGVWISVSALVAPTVKNSADTLMFWRTGMMIGGARFRIACWR